VSRPHPPAGSVRGNASASAAIEEPLRAALDEVAEAVVMIDADQRIVVFNHAACAMFGYEADEMLGEPLDVLLPADAAERHRRQVVEFAAGAVPRRSMSERRTLSGRRRDGSEFPVEITIARTRFGGRELFNAVIRDVSIQRREHASLTASLDRFRALVEHASDGVVICDAEGRVLWANPYAERFSGEPDGGLVGTAKVELIHPDDLRRIAPRLAEMLATPAASVRYETRMRRHDGRWVWTDVVATNLLDDPAIGGIVVNFCDISERKLADAQREGVAALGSRALTGCLFEPLARDAMRLIVELLDADAAAVLEQVDADAEMLAVRACAGWDESLLGRSMVAPVDPPNHRTLADGAVVVDDYRDVPSFPSKNLIDAAGIRSSLAATIRGRDRPWGLIGVISREPARFSTTDASFVQAVANVLAGAIERDHAADDAARQALRDPLTGLANRALLKDRIERGLAAVRRSRRSGIVVQIIDIDDFKRVNETYGHDVGDELIRQVAHRLRFTVREEDTVARFGGDEFVIVTVRDRRREDTLRFVERILTAIRQPFHVDGHVLRLSASVGIASSSPRSDTADALLRDADLAVHQAKANGRDQYVIFDKKVRAQLHQRREIERDLGVAIARDEFRVFYQPVVESTTGEIVGVEALVRWVHPERGLIPPLEFIPIAEDSGMIRAIGRYVIRAACEQVAHWQRELDRPHLDLSVNLSAHQLTDPDLLGYIRDVLSSSGIAPTTLSLEMTETSLVQNLGEASRTLGGLAELGVGILIDDFGTGYSSLAYLKHLPVHGLKIDRAFIRDISDDPNDRAIVASVIELARQLGIGAVVEGVENEEQLATVQSLGCTVVQGHFYAPALAPEEFESWLRKAPATNHRGTPGAPTPDRGSGVPAGAGDEPPPQDSVHDIGTAHVRRRGPAPPELLSKQAVGRFAALLWLCSAGITLASPLLPAPSSMNRVGILAVGGVAVLFGLVLLALPWNRWPRSASLWLAGLPAQALIGLHNSFGGSDPFRYGLFFMICYVWVGLAQPRWSSMKLLPFTAAAYTAPLVVTHRPEWAIASVLYALPLFALTSETTAWISDRLRASHEMLSAQAFRDPLTGAGNRSELYTRAERAFARAHRLRTAFGLLFIDLDGFKQINDDHGHEVGDRVLRETAARLRNALRAHDILVRIGGDEFAVLVDHANSTIELEQIAQRLLDAMRRPFPIGRMDVRVTASIGIACATSETQNLDDLLRESDRAMYRAKEAGGDAFRTSARATAAGALRYR
jgi:diguanylate cyclase (GGDEF)-like protein/PAS domain S-box-containing protein